MLIPVLWAQNAGYVSFYLLLHQVTVDVIIHSLYEKAALLAELLLILIYLLGFFQNANRPLNLGQQ